MSVWSRAKAFLQTIPQMQGEVLVFGDIQIRIVRRHRTRRLCLRLEAFNEARLTCPKRASHRILSEFVRSRTDWLTRQNEEAKKWIVWQGRKGHAGEPYLLQGRELILKDAVTVLPKAFVAPARHTVDEIYYYWPERDFEKRDLLRFEVFRDVRRFLDQEAERYLKNRSDVVTELMKLRPQRIRFRNQKSRWGSCNTAGTISLNRRLVGAPEWVVDAVLIHEFAHLKFLNHGEQFWQLVNAYCPNHEEADRWLNENHFRLL